LGGTFPYMIFDISELLLFFLGGCIIYLLNFFPAN
jgi:hypothetical protein